MTHPIMHISAASAETVYVLGDTVRFRGGLDGTDTVLIEVTVPPGAGVPLHRHRSPEIFRVLSGTITFSLLDNHGTERSIAAGPGDVVNVPSDIPHGYANRGATSAEVLVVLDRAMEQFFRDLGSPRPAPAGPPTPEVLAQVGTVAEKHGITFIANSTDEDLRGSPSSVNSGLMISKA
jgi:quercetin dioxygenase-like cupin family protein